MSSSSKTDDFGYPHPDPQPPLQNPYSTVVIIFTLFGCLVLFVAFVASIWWFMKRRKEKKLMREKKNIDVDEHLKVQELIMQGPRGPKKVLVSMEDDIHVHEGVNKNEIDMVSKDGVAQGLGHTSGGSKGSGATSSDKNLTLPERQV